MLRKKKISWLFKDVERRDAEYFASKRILNNDIPVRVSSYNPEYANEVHDWHFEASVTISWREEA